MYNINFKCPYCKKNNSASIYGKFSFPLEYCCDYCYKGVMLEITANKIKKSAILKPKAKMKIRIGDWVLIPKGTVYYSERHMMNRTAGKSYKVRVTHTSDTLITWTSGSYLNQTDIQNVKPV